MREMILHSAQLVSAVTNYCLNWAFTVTVVSQTLKAVGVGGGGSWQWAWTRGSMIAPVKKFG